MAESVAWLSIVGINENGLDGVCAEARARIAAASLVVGGKRHLQLADAAIKGKTMAWPSPPHDAIPALLSLRPEPVCVLATGDPFHYGIGSVLLRSIPIDEMRVFPNVPIASLVAARLGWTLQETVLIGLNGQPIERIIPHLQPGARIIALSADEKTPGRLAALLSARGFGAASMTILEHLGGKQERMRQAAAQDFAFKDIARLNCLAIEIPDNLEAKKRAIPIASGLEDALFEHDGQLTKREIRAVTLSALAPRRGELLWDIGLGAGSVAIEWLLRDRANRAIGFEKNGERAARAARNAKALGVPQLVVLEGEAPEALAGLEAPDAIFIGGGAAAPCMIETAWVALKPGGRLVMNAISLESEALLLAAHKRYGGALIRIGIERAEPIGNMTGWRPAMTVTQWSVTK